MNGNFTVVGIDNDGCLICKDDKTGREFNCGETLELFGVENLTDKERLILGVD